MALSLQREGGVQGPHCDALVLLFLWGLQQTLPSHFWALKTRRPLPSCPAERHLSTISGSYGQQGVHLGSDQGHPDNKVVLTHLLGAISRLSVVTRKAQDVKTVTARFRKACPCNRAGPMAPFPWRWAVPGLVPRWEHGAPSSCPTNIQTHN